MARRATKKRPVVIREAEFFSIELAPVPDGTFHLSISGCYLMSARPFLAATAISIWPASTTLTSTGLTTLERLQSGFLKVLFRFYFRIRPKFTTTQRALDST
jgi:hypothetical protein